MEKLLDTIASIPVTAETLNDAFAVIIETKDRELAHKWCAWIRKGCREVMSADTLELYWKTYRFEAQMGDFDAYCIYLERYREPEKKFYLPRRKVLRGLVADLQDLFDGEIKFLGISLPPRIGKSTLCIFFMTFVMGHRPEVANVMSGHSSALTEGFYQEIYTILTSPEDYAWGEVFSGIEIVNKSAKNYTIDLQKRKRFPSITCRSIGGTLTGAVEIGNGGVLYCDDLIEDLEESLNPERLENKYNAYLNQLKDRKKNDAVELMVGTRWNVFDPLGRIQMQYENNPEYRFTVIPALDEEDESNFDYEYGMGFTTEYYHDMRESIDDATWWAKYMGQPYVREGLLFPEAELKYYNGVLPEGEPDRKIFACDTAFGGGDSVACPFGYVYGDSCYIHDVIFNNGDKTVTIPAVVGKIKKHMPHMGRFEANNGGEAYAEKVDNELRNDGIKINISSKRAPTTQSKLSRIIQFAPEIKNLYFLDTNSRDKEYRAFMNEVTMFVQNGKNKHDDAPDSLAMLVDFLNSGKKVVSAVRRPF